MEKPESQEMSSGTSEYTGWKKFVDELKAEWKHLWWSRIDDEVRAEGIASDEFPKLFVERGTVIVATRDYKPPNLREILAKYAPAAIADQVDPNPAVGGIGKFIRTFIRRQTPSRVERPSKTKRGSQQRKQGGRGWIHYTLRRESA